MPSFSQNLLTLVMSGKIPVVFLNRQEKLRIDPALILPTEILLHVGIIGQEKDCFFGAPAEIQHADNKLLTSLQNVIVLVPVLWNLKEMYLRNVSIEKCLRDWVFTFLLDLEVRVKIGRHGCCTE